MIDSVNETQASIGYDLGQKRYRPIAGLTTEDRKSILNRALHAVPFFNLVTLPFVHTNGVKTLFKTKINVDIDFYLTEIRASFEDIVSSTGQEWNINIYTADSGRSVYGFNRGQPLPTSFITTEARAGNGAVPRLFDDRQRELIPKFIPRGDEIIIEVETDAVVDVQLDVNIMLVGFNMINYPYLTTDETRLINNSLGKITNFQTFSGEAVPDSTQVTKTRQFFNIRNDNSPRLILALGIRDLTDHALVPVRSTISIEDTTRELKLTNIQIPVEFLAPRVPYIFDQHVYYWPIEHYFMPFGNIRFQIENIFTNAPPAQDQPYQLTVLTRTV